MNLQIENSFIKECTEYGIYKTYEVSFEISCHLYESILNRNKESEQYLLDKIFNRS